MLYPELQAKLELNHLYFSPIIEQGKGGEKQVGLYQYVPAILNQMRMEAVKKVVDETEFTCTWHPNQQEIHIKKIE
jgi:hypothetical protein